MSESATEKGSLGFRPEPFCSYIDHNMPVDRWDDPVQLAFKHGLSMQDRMNRALDDALIIDKAQTVYHVMDGTSHRNPFDALRAAIDAAEELAIGGY